MSFQSRTEIELLKIVRAILPTIGVDDANALHSLANQLDGRHDQSSDAFFV
jgi:hypothetical protein